MVEYFYFCYFHSFNIFFFLKKIYSIFKKKVNYKIFLKLKNFFFLNRFEFFLNFNFYLLKHDLNKNVFVDIYRKTYKNIFENYKILKNIFYFKIKKKFKKNIQYFFFFFFLKKFIFFELKTFNVFFRLNYVSSYCEYKFFLQKNFFFSNRRLFEDSKLSYILEFVFNKYFFFFIFLKIHFFLKIFHKKKKVFDTNILSIRTLNFLINDYFTLSIFFLKDKFFFFFIKKYLRLHFFYFFFYFYYFKI